VVYGCLSNVMQSTEDTSRLIYHPSYLLLQVHIMSHIQDAQQCHRLPPDIGQRVYSPGPFPVTMDFTTASGKPLRVRVPRSVFDQLCLHHGNAYKAGCWITVRCCEVETLSIETITRYVNMMAKNMLNRDGTMPQMLPIEVSSTILSTVGN